METRSSQSGKQQFIFRSLWDMGWFLLNVVLLIVSTFVGFQRYIPINHFLSRKPAHVPALQTTPLSQATGTYFFRGEEYQRLFEFLPPDVRSIHDSLASKQHYDHSQAFLVTNASLHWTRVEAARPRVDFDDQRTGAHAFIFCGEQSPHIASLFTSLLQQKPRARPVLVASAGSVPHAAAVLRAGGPVDSDMLFFVDCRPALLDVEVLASDRMTASVLSRMHRAGLTRHRNTGAGQLLAELTGRPAAVLRLNAAASDELLAGQLSSLAHVSTAQPHPRLPSILSPLMTGSTLLLAVVAVVTGYLCVCGLLLQGASLTFTAALVLQLLALGLLCLGLQLLAQDILTQGALVGLFMIALIPFARLSVISCGDVSSSATLGLLSLALLAVAVFMPQCQPAASVLLFNVSAAVISLLWKGTATSAIFLLQSPLLGGITGFTIAALASVPHGELARGTQFTTLVLAAWSLLAYVTMLAHRGAASVLNDWQLLRLSLVCLGLFTVAVVSFTIPASAGFIRAQGDAMRASIWMEPQLPASPPTGEVDLHLSGGSLRFAHHGQRACLLCASGATLRPDCGSCGAWSVPSDHYSCLLVLPGSDVLGSSARPLSRALFCDA